MWDRKSVAIAGLALSALAVWVWNWGPIATVDDTSALAADPRLAPINGDCPLEGAWVGSSARGDRFSETISAIPGDLDRLASTMTTVVDITLGGLFPNAQSISAARGEIARSAENTWDYTLVAYGKDAVGGLVYIAVFAGTRTAGDACTTYDYLGTISAFTPTADADPVDGLPDDGVAPIACVPDAGTLSRLGTRDPCPLPIGACCLPDDTCAASTEFECDLQGGSYQGDGSDCANVRCVPALGACCWINKACVEMTQDSCHTSGGRYFGDDTICANVDCTVSLGACCLADGRCARGVPLACQRAGGVYQGDGTTCDAVNCPQPAFGACCLPEGFCETLTEIDCVDLDGVYQGDNILCEQVDCPIPIGACCVGDGACVADLTAEGCLAMEGLFQGPLSTCTPNDCPRQVVSGACCLPEGFCETLGEADCVALAGVYEGDNILCEQVNCPTPVGACCTGNGGCTEDLTAEVCSAMEGSFQGPLSTCTPNDCPQPLTGACCDMFSGLCTDGVTRADCPKADLQWTQGAACDTLDPPCLPPALGACCLPDATCFIDPKAWCDMAGGVYQGDHTMCVPGLCPDPVGACCLSTGVCVASRTEVACDALGGSFRGGGTVCLPNRCPQPPDRR